jgi:hypothetical protein
MWPGPPLLRRANSGAIGGTPDSPLTALNPALMTHLGSGLCMAAFETMLIFEAVPHSTDSPAVGLASLIEAAANEAQPRI